MSYDVYLNDKDGNVCEVKHHHYEGGTSVLGGTTDAWLNITYNYNKTLDRVLGEKGIRELYGKRAQDTIPLLDSAIHQLGSEPPSRNYFDDCDGNVRVALEALLSFARQQPKGIWSGD